MEEKKKSLSSISKRKLWYILLLLASSLYVFINRNNIGNLTVLTVQNLIFYLWLVLLFFPLFSEMEFMGIKLKKEVENVKKEIKDEIKELRFQISNSASATINYLPSKEQLIETIEEIGIKIPQKENINKEDKESYNNKYDEAFLLLKEAEEERMKTVNEAISVSEKAVFLFKARLSIETILSELCNKTGYNGSHSFNSMIKYLVSNEYITEALADIIFNIVGIANRGIHGEIVSTEYLDFVEFTIPEIIKRLQEINKKLK